MTYVPLFEEVPAEYTVNWIVNGETIPGSGFYGEMPVYPGDMEWVDGDYKYIITGWTPELTTITGSVTYTATVEQVKNTYIITWDVEGELTEEDYNYGDTPAYPYGTPAKAEDANYTYTFTGWTPEISAVTGDVTYTAVFEATAKVVSHIASKSKTLELKDLVQVNYYFTVTGDFTEEYLLENGGLLVWLEDNISEGKDYVAGSESYSITGLTLTSKGYQVKANGVAAKKLGDRMIARGYIINAEGEYEYSELIDYNALTYINNILSKSGATYEAYHPVLVSLLNYGAGAQIYFDYKTDDLMNKNLTDAHKALTSYDASQVKALKTDTSKYNIAYDIVEDKLGRTLELADNINIKMKYTLSSAVTTGAQKIQVLYWNEAAYNAATELTYDNATDVLETTIESGNIYVGTITGIAPKDMGSTYYVCLYVEYEDGVGHYTNISTYSIHEYTAKRAAMDQSTATEKNKKLYSLCQMIINYSYEADKKFN